MISLDIQENWEKFFDEEVENYLKPRHFLKGNLIKMNIEKEKSDFTFSIEKPIYKKPQEIIIIENKKHNKTKKLF